MLRLQGNLCKEVLWIVRNSACALVSLWLFSTVSRQMMSNSYHEWTMCLVMCILIACVFLSECIFFVQRVQAWKRRYVMCKRLFDCIAARARLMIFERFHQGRNWRQSNRINTMEQKQVDMRPSMLWHQPTSQKGVTLGGMQLRVL